MINVMIRSNLSFGVDITMIHMTLIEAMTVLGQKETPKTNPSFTGMSIDTRTLNRGNLFVALPGSRVNGHDYLSEAQEKGAAAAIVEHLVPSTLPQIQVNDAVAAIGKLAAAWRSQFSIPFIAITGSNGKTTLKNMMAAILTAACVHDHTKVLSPEGTFNNHLGLPLTLTRLNAHHRFAVLEMGMNHFGEIAYLTKCTRPSLAIITNAAACHLEGVGDVAGVARAKAEIFLGLPPHGKAILNRDDPFFHYWLEQLGNREWLSFGFSKDAHVHAAIHSAAHASHVTFYTPSGQFSLHLPLLGKHNVLNALAATAAALSLNIPFNTIKIGLESISPVPGRLQLHKLGNGVNIIDDTYNANPFSLNAAIDTLAHFNGKKILVLSDMKELGKEAKHYHHLAGEQIREAGIDYLFTYGELSAAAAAAFGEGAYHFNEQEKLLTALKPFLYNPTTILIKGSRSMKMEKIVAGLLPSQSY